jgi:hypothetical protein
MSMKAVVLTAAAVATLGLAGWLAFHSGAESGIHTADSAQPAPVASAASTTQAEAPAATPNTVGSAPTVQPDLNANVASVAEAARTGKHPERLSPLIAPKPFDAATFASNPQAYLDVVEPGRVFQTAAPGLQVPVLRSNGSASHEIPVGGSCTLAVVTAPKAPVTFVTLDLGTFPNSLTAITVQANDRGEASTVYSASGGVIADVQVMAGSPMASGQVNFHVFVTSQQPVAAVK